MERYFDLVAVMAEPKRNTASQWIAYNEYQKLYVAANSGDISILMKRTTTRVTARLKVTNQQPLYGH